MPSAKVFLLSLATLSASAFGQNANPARPGTLNYIEGQASIEGRPLSPRSIGNTELSTGQTIATANGKAEVLLTPGVFLRLGNDSTVEMIKPDLMHTEIKLERGQADLEVNQIFDQNRLLVDEPNGQTQVLKRGLYAFDAGKDNVRVFDGQAQAYPGPNLIADVKPIEIKGDRQYSFDTPALKPARFDKNEAEGDLYQWSSLRSNYLGEANLNLAQQYEGAAGFNPGWYWAGDPFGYTWLPGDGLFWGPFGDGFYSPFYLGGGGFIYGRGGYGYRGGGFAGRPGGLAGGGVRGGFAGGGGGFHGGGGGGHR